MNIWDIDKIIHVHIHSTQMHMYIKYEVSNTNILGVININMIKLKIWLLNEDYL